MALTPEQHERRLLGIGASEAAAAVGLSRYTTPLDIFRRKTGVVGDKLRNAIMAQMGTAIENTILDWYETETGIVGTRFPDTMVSAKYPWMFAHLDWLGSDRVTDAKLTGGSEYGEPGTDQIPQEVMCQLHHQMIVAEKEFAQVAMFAIVYYGRGRSGLEFRTYDVPYQKELGDLIIEGEFQLWENVKNLTPPPAVDLADEVKLWLVSTQRTVEADTEVLAAAAQARELDSLIDTLNEERQQAILRIQCAMKDADTLVSGREIVATWKSSKPRQGIDLDKLRAEYPEAARACSIVTDGSRRFVLKGEK